VDVRVISATNRDLEKMIEDGDFREDVYYRLNVFPINLPPLRERLDDLPVLVSHFIAKFARQMGVQMHPPMGDAITKLREYNWPGNVRELENIIERAMILVKAERLEAGDLDFGRRAQQATGGGGAVPAPVARSREQTQPMPNLAPVSSMFSGPPPGSSSDPTASGSRPLSERLADEERREIVAAVDKSSGNIALAARLLGINRSTLYYRLRKHGLEHLLPTKGVVGTTSGSHETAMPVVDGPVDPES